MYNASRRLHKIDTLNQCCGYEMIYSGPGSSFEFSEFRIRIQAILFKYRYRYPKFGNKIKTPEIQSNRRIYKYLPVLQYTQSRIHREIKILFICFSYLAGSGTLIPDPDPCKVQDPCGSGSTTLFAIQ